MQTVEVGKKLIERRLNDYPTALEVRDDNLPPWISYGQR
jgi:hypothetical protein